LLDGRIAANVRGQQVDLTEWIFRRVEIQPGSRVLELCCGTGSQTLKLLELVGERGHVVAVDISREALDGLVANVPAAWQARLTPVEANLDDLGRVLDSRDMSSPQFDLVFCAYGLYYSSRTLETMAEIDRCLRREGKFVIIGPFGPNNGPLFDLLARCGVEIPPYVKHTSSDFMFHEVIPWLSTRFGRILIDTLVNRITWENVAGVLEYWQSTTFFEAEKLRVVVQQLNQHFSGHATFVNEKWIMMLEAARAHR
jgi:ubiquinone/menaquinone biosynthesis C-methylase UbiE